MVESIMQGDVEEVVVSHRDRLCRFAFELVEWICNKRNTNLVVKNKEIRSADAELSEDLMAIVHVFSCRHNGMRRYGKGSGRGSQGQVVSEDSSQTNSTASSDTAEVDDISKEDLQHRSAHDQGQDG